MKKTLILGLMFFILISLSACAKKDKNEVKQKNNKAGLEVVAHKSLKDWFKKGKAVQCKIKTSNGTVVVSTKGNDVYMEGIPYFGVGADVGDNNAKQNLNNGAMLTIGDWTYMWDKKTKKGTKMNNKEMGNMGENKEEEKSENLDKMTKEWEDSGFEYECEDVSAKKALFNVPQDVEFQDLSEMMKGLNGIGKNLEKQMNEGNMDMSDINLDELKDKMKNIK